MKLSNEQQIFMSAHLKLAKYTVKRFFKNPTIDDYQNAIIGLCIATLKFNPSKGFKFSSYAVPTIKGYIQKQRYKENLIRLYNKVDRYKYAAFAKKAYVWLVSDLDNVFLDQEIPELEYQDTIDFLFAALTKREKYILYMRIGKNVHLNKIGEKLKISRERVRQIEIKALFKIEKRRIKFNIENPFFTGSQRKNVTYLA